MRLADFHSLEKKDAWTVHLQDVFQTLKIPPDTVSDHLVASIAMYCRKFHPQGVQSTDLKLLIARAFCSVGERHAAACVLESMEPHCRHVSRWLEILSELHHFPELLAYFSQAIIRPADWAGAQVERMWTLDFGRLGLAESERHEIMLYRSIRAILEKMFVFWDATGGEGILGLKDLAALQVDAEGWKNETLTAPADLLEYMADLFRKQQTLRDWHTVPSLLNLDF